MGVVSVAITTSGREITKELGSVANEKTVQVDVMRKGENEHEKINGWENGKHVTCHSE